MQTGEPDVVENDPSASLAAAMLEFRRTRSSILPPELFAEPAWDLLLELFIADAEGRRLTARQVCIRAGIAPSVMSHWLKHLSQSGFVTGDGEGDLDDLLTMSAGMLDSMEKMMDRAQTLRAKVS